MPIVAPAEQKTDPQAFGHTQSRIRRIRNDRLSQEVRETLDQMRDYGLTMNFAIRVVGDQILLEA